MVQLTLLFVSCWCFVQIQLLLNVFNSQEFFSKWSRSFFFGDFSSCEFWSGLLVEAVWGPDRLALSAILESLEQLV